MHASKGKTTFADGAVSCTLSFTNPFTSTSVNFFEANATSYGIMAFDADARGHNVVIYLDKDIIPGTYKFSPSSTVSASYCHNHGTFGWTYHADKGTLKLTSVDFDKNQVDGTFEFTSTVTPDGQPVVATEGVFTLTGSNA
ncbi:DUF6252 family protein [Pseudomonas sp.]|uniref:DUF6252 family protein n=1 Tax=Pseudomonas sp. TaxID=306 RepID=UPI0026117AEF|nr:DUF6252 family protein [Pseudomonas sp.]